jgi:hypothetical protein
MRVGGASEAQCYGGVVAIARARSFLTTSSMPFSVSTRLRLVSLRLIFATVGGEPSHPSRKYPQQPLPVRFSDSSHPRSHQRNTCRVLQEAEGARGPHSEVDGSTSRSLRSPCGRRPEDGGGAPTIH